MSLRRVLFSGCGAEKPYTKEIEVQENAFGEAFVLVPIPIRAYEKLGSFASISRTIDGIMRAEPCVEAYEALDELEELQPALHDIHQAIHEHKRRQKNV